MQDSVGWNASALVLAVVDSGDAADVPGLLWWAWRQLSVADFTVLLAPRSQPGTWGRSLTPSWSVHTIFPFANASGLCGRGESNSSFLRAWRPGRASPSDAALLFPDKRPLDLRGCRLPVNLQYDPNLLEPSFFIPEGFGMAVLNAITRFLNASALRVPAPPDQVGHHSLFAVRNALTVLAPPDHAGHHSLFAVRNALRIPAPPDHAGHHSLFAVKNALRQDHHEEER